MAKDATTYEMNVPDVVISVRPSKGKAGYIRVMTAMMRLQFNLEGYS